MKGSQAAQFLYLAIYGLALSVSTSSAQIETIPGNFLANEEKLKQGPPMITRNRGIALTEQIRQARQQNQLLHGMRGDATRSEPKDKPTIISGTIVADRTKAPFLARLHWPNVPDRPIFPENLTYYCVGSLVTTKSVLTAARCLPARPGTSVNVYLGDLRVMAKNEPGEVMIPAGDWRSHPEYLLSYDVDFDIGILILDTPATLTPQVQLISLPSSSTYTIGNDPVQVTSYGWGRYTLIPQNFTGFPSIMSDELRLGLSKGRQWRDECRLVGSRTGDRRYSPQRLICLNASETGQSMCTSDGGGPAVLTLNGRATLVGVLSHWIIPPNFNQSQGINDPCDSRILHGAVNVAYHLDWIESNLDVVLPRRNGSTNSTANSKMNSLLTRGWQLLTRFFG